MKKPDDLILDEDLKAESASPFWGNSDNERAQADFDKEEGYTNVQHKAPTVTDVFPRQGVTHTAKPPGGSLKEDRPKRKKPDAASLKLYCIVLP